MRKLRATISLFFIIVVFAVSTFFTSCSNQETKNKPFGAIQEVDFDYSMGKGTEEYQIALTNSDDLSRYNTFKKVYEENLPSKVLLSQSPKIPKIIHQIWLGPKTPPSYFASFQAKWRKMHPDWEYHLWTDDDLDELNLELRDLIEASPNYAEKSDILRCELLERFGGVYLDADMDPSHSLDELHLKYDFYAGVEQPHKIATTNNYVWVGISIMASKPNHPIMKRWKEYIRARWEMVDATYSSAIERVINHTYFPFSFAVLEKIKEDNLTNMLFPATYFYPYSAANAAKRRSEIRGIREKFYEFLEKINLKKARAFSRIYPETLAVHYWGNTWISTSKEQIMDLQQQLDFLKKDFITLQHRLRQVEKTTVAAEKTKSTKRDEKITLKAS
ncbi:MAG: hypothetical protein JWO53_469 [Chlamydiia bacterium]|nr:hypothetical protein [Chlamydiia bacterium]